MRKYVGTLSITTKIRCALVGLGNQAIEHLIASIDHSDLEIIAGIDANQATWKKVKVLFPQLNLRCFTSLEEINTSSLEIDAFILALPHHAYENVWADLMAYKKPLLKEKPLGRDYQEALKFMQEARQAGCGLQTAIQRRTHPSYQFLFDQLKNEKVQIIELHAHLAKENKPDENFSENWRKLRKLAGGGALLDAGYHLIDLIQYYIGDFDVISNDVEWRLFR